MEQPNLSPGNNEESFNTFKDKINERATLYKNVISSFFSEVALVDKYKEYQDQIDSEVFLCITKVKELMDTTTKEVSKSVTNQKAAIDELFNTPIKTLDIQLEATKIMLDDKPYDVWQKKHDEFNKKIDELEKDESLKPDQLQKLQEVKQIFNSSLEDLFESKNEQLNNLRNLFDLSQKEQFSITAKDKKVNLDNKINIENEIVASYNMKVTEIVGTLDFNLREIMEKSFSDFNSEKNNLN